MVEFSDFKKLDMRIGEIKEVENHPQADRLYLLKVDVGEKIIRLVAGLRQHYEAEELKGKKIVVITNLQPRQIRGITSEGMLLAASQEGVLSLLTVDREIGNGAAIS